MNNDSIKKTIIVALSLCIVCSVLVSGSAVLLKDKQIANAALDKKKNILMTAGLLGENTDAQSVESTFEKNVQSVLYDFSNNTFKTDVPKAYDQRKAAKDPQTSTQIESDYAKIKTRANEGVVYFVRGEDSSIEQVIFPIHGKGLWSTLYGFISIGNDLNTVKGISFYEHKETPGLGGEVDNPKWKSLWEGKVIYDKSGNVKLQVIKGQVEPNSPVASYKVDGMSGATITSRGVSEMIRYWFGSDAYGPMIKKYDIEALKQKLSTSETDEDSNTVAKVEDK